MSVRIMSLVWDNFKQGGSEKLVMLAMADWCNDEGLSLHPSHEAVAKKCCISRSQAQRVTKALVDAGWLEVVGNQFGGAPGTTKRYRLCIEKLRETGSTHATGSVDATGSIQNVRRVAPSTETGSTHATQTTIEPSIEPPVKSKSAPATRLPADWMPSEVDIQFCKTNRPDLNAKDVADGFRDYWIAQPGAKGRKLDWPATWRNWVRNQRRSDMGRASPKPDNFENRQYGHGGKL